MVEGEAGGGEKGGGVGFVLGAEGDVTVGLANIALHGDARLCEREGRETQRREIQLI
jgi:hypothetical protein